LEGEWNGLWLPQGGECRIDVSREYFHREQVYLGCEFGGSRLFLL